MAKEPKQADGRENDWELRWSLLVADAWADPAIMKRLQTDPAAVLKERRISPPANVQVKVVEDTPNLMHLVIPAKPSATELSEEELTSVSGGYCGGCSGGCGGCGGGCSRPCGGGGCFPCRPCGGGGCFPRPCGCHT